MNRFMRSYVPERSASPRKSTTGTPTKPVPADSTARKRHSVAVVNFAQQEDDEDMLTPPNATDRGNCGSPNAAMVSLSKRSSFHENLLIKLLSNTPLLEESFSSDCASPIEDPETPERLIQFESDELLRCTTPVEQQPTSEVQLVLANNPRLARLYRDLRSPSATTRIRALRALKSPSKRDAYGQFDVPHEQQDIITADERHNPKPKSIKELLANVCVYVEVRTGADNRSEGIKDHLAALGAKVNDRLYKDTTHVIFKDGLLSTYQKAKKMNIPIVSILWIEAIKKHRCLMNPDAFPISNRERYENPELFKKIRRQKSMQPRAEEAINYSAGKKRLQIPITPASVNGRTVTPPSKLPVLHRIPNNADSCLERLLNEFEAEIRNTPEPEDDFDRLVAVPPKRLLEQFRNSPLSTTSMGNSKKLTRKNLFVAGNPANESGGSIDVSTMRITRRRSVEVNDSSMELKTANARQRRKTMLLYTTPSIAEESESPAVDAANKKPTPMTDSEASKARRSRRKTIAVPVSVTFSSTEKPQKRETISSPKAMELCKVNSAPDEDQQQIESNRENIPPMPEICSLSPSQTKQARGTIYSPLQMEQTRLEKQKTDKMVDEEAEKHKKNGLNNHHSFQTPTDPKDLRAFRTSRRRTLYTPGVYETNVGESSTPVGSRVTDHNSSSSSNRRRTLFNPVANSTATDKLSDESQAKSSSSPQQSCNGLNSNSNSSNFNTHLVVLESLDIPETPNSNEAELEQRPASRLTFSSTKTPGSVARRRTMFDLPMDIIERRLTQINMLSAKKDKTDREVQASPAKQETPRPSNLLMKPSPSPKSPAQFAASSTTSPRQTSLDVFYRKLTKSGEKKIVDRFKSPLLNSSHLPPSSSSISSARSVPPGETNASSDTVQTVESTTKKRKLFTSQSIASSGSSSSTSSGSFGGAQTTLPPESPKLSSSLPKRPKTTTTTPVIRKSLVPAAAAALRGAAGGNRRSTILFESRPPAGDGKPRVISTQQPVMGTQARALKANRIFGGLPTVTATQRSTANGGTIAGTSPFRFHLATTNLHSEQATHVQKVGGGIL